MNAIIRPITTEKTMKDGASTGSFTFLVEKNATKREIKNSLWQLFNVNAKEIQTVTIKGTRKRSGKRRIKVKVGPWKKAIVKLASGQKITLLGKEEKNESSK